MYMLTTFLEALVSVATSGAPIKSFVGSGAYGGSLSMTYVKITLHVWGGSISHKGVKSIVPFQVDELWDGWFEV